MNILCVIDSLGSGGAQRQLVNLALSFKERGNDVSFLVYYKNDFYKEILLEKGIAVNEIIEPNYFKRLWKLRFFIRNNKYDSILSFLEGANFICEVSSLPIRKWKLIVGERSANPNILKSIKLRFFRIFHFLADYVVANSDANMKMVRRINPFLKDNKCSVIYNLIDIPKNENSSNIIHEKFVIVVAASHVKNKNLIGVLKALNKLPAKEKDKIIIKWFGNRIMEPFFDDSFQEAQKLIKKYNLNNLIEFYPAIKDICTYYAQADAIGLFSKYEGLPNAVCEGMAAAKPIVCSAISDIPLILSHQSNLLFDPNDINSISQALSNILNCSNENLKLIGEQNRLVSEQLFSKDLICDKYLQLLS